MAIFGDVFYGVENLHITIDLIDNIKFLIREDIDKTDVIDFIVCQHYDRYYTQSPEEIYNACLKEVFYEDEVLKTEIGKVLYG